MRKHILEENVTFQSDEGVEHFPSGVWLIAREVRLSIDARLTKLGCYLLE